jgi:hypothetical protein
VAVDNWRSHVAAAVALVAAVALALSCGGGSSPSTPSKPIPTAAPTPTPSGGGSVGPTCRLSNGDPNAQCVDAKSGSQLIDYVFRAMDDLAAQRPTLFNKNDEAGAGTGNYRILDVEGYLNGIVALLQSYGLCAQRDPGDYLFQQINVKNTNDFSEDFKVMTSNGFVWHNGGAFKSFCTPASFPLNYAVIDVPPPGSGCGRPYPPPLNRFNSKVHIPGGEYDLLDSTPIVRDAEYCAAIGYTDGRIDCPLRLEQSPERKACENWRVGIAKDTGVPGPTWTLDGHYCTGRDSGCENFAENQYGLKAYAGGTYRMCSKDDVCGELVVVR